MFKAAVSITIQSWKSPQNPSMIEKVNCGMHLPPTTCVNENEQTPGARNSIGELYKLKS